ncbi:MAG: dihydroneopterin aldolase [Alphaproteobacteria bacterium]|nr:dihydroneopterin aldolase [Alphaproteobacteria bacterium]
MKAAAGTGEAALWDAGRSYQRVILRDMVVEVRLGLHPWERHPERPQRVVVNVELFARQDGPFAGSGVAAVLDYDRIRDAVRAWPLRGHTDLIETLLEELVALCFADGRVEACRVSILKPDIFNETGGAGVEIYRVRGEGA